MEEIYPPDQFGASINFPLKRYFEEYRTLVPQRPEEIIIDDEVMDDEEAFLCNMQFLMGNTLTVMELKQLEVSCSLDLLKCDGENTIDFPMKITENLRSGTKLPTSFKVTSEKKQLEVNLCKMELEKKKSVLELCYGNKRFYHKTIEFETSSDIDPDLTPGCDFLLSILIYKPFPFKYFNSKNVSEKLRFNHEILALGRNTLAEVRDKIVCPADEGICEEVEDTSVDLKPFANAKSKYPSNFIFVDSVFFNDFRAPDAIDYSQPIKEWAETKLKKKLTSNKYMEKVHLNELNPRFGYPYLYLHLGDCEHLLVFSDARLLQESDCLHSQCYPHVSKCNRQINKKCFLCTVALAKWICIDSNRFPQRKVFLCTDCCNSYNYIDGKKVGEFKLYPYYEKHVVDITPS